MQQWKLIAGYVLVFALAGCGGGGGGGALPGGDLQTLSQATSTPVTLVEDFEDLPAQTSTVVTGYSDGDAFYGLFDDVAASTPVSLRTTLGEAGVEQFAAVVQSSNTFGRGSIDAEASYQDSVESKDFIGILDFPAGIELAAAENDVRTYTPVGDFAGLRDEPVGVDGATFSIDVRLPQSVNFAVYVRFLFSDADDQASTGSGDCEEEEYVTTSFSVPNDGAWHTISVTVSAATTFNRLPDGCTLPAGETWVFSRESIWPIGLEILRQASIGTQSAPMLIDFDNFKAAGIVLPDEGDDGCTYSHGYWKNHTSDWPVAGLTLDGESYGASTLLTWLQQPTKGSAWKILARQWVAAMLNVENGASDAAVDDDLEDAAAWLADHIDGYAKSEKATATDLADILDDFNNGVIGPGSCEDD